MIVVPGLDRRASLALAGEFLEEIKAAAALLEEVPGERRSGPCPARAPPRRSGGHLGRRAPRLGGAAAAIGRGGKGGRRRRRGDLAAMRGEVLDTAAETVAALRAALAEPALV